MSAEPQKGEGLRRWTVAISIFSALIALISLYVSWLAQDNSNQMKSDQALGQAWDLLGGSSGSTWLYALPSDRSQVELALRKVREAQHLTPKEPRVAWLRGICLEAQGELDEAEESYQRAVQLDRTYTPGYVNRALLLLRQGRTDEALEALSDVPEAIAGEPAILDQRGQIQFHLQSYEEARELFLAALEDPSPPPSVHNNLGVLLMVTGDLPGAEARFRQTVRSAPEWGRPRTNLGIVSMLQGKNQVAKDHFEEAIRLDPCDDQARFHLRQILENEGHEERADELDRASEKRLRVSGSSTGSGEPG